jgi:hypothetical protein
MNFIQSLIKDQSITIEALKVGVWVDSGSVYSGFKNNESFYTGINRETGGSDYIAHIGSSQAFMMNIPSDVNTSNYTVKKFLYSFSRPGIAAPFINASVITTSSGGSFQYNIGTDFSSSEVLMADFLYLSLWGEASYNYTFVMYSVTRYSLAAYYCQIRILKQTGQMQQSTYFLQEVNYDDLPYIKDILNNFCYKNYYVPLLNYGENQDDNYIYIVTGMDCFKSTDYVISYSIDYQNTPGSFWSRNRLQISGNSRVSSGAVKRFLFTQSSHELSVLVYGKRNDVDDKCHAAVLSFKGSAWDNIRNSSDVWSIYDNFPAAFTDKMGNNMWVSSNLKWMFTVLYGTTDKPYGKGLVTVKSATPIIGKTGWSSTTYYIDDDSTLEIRNAVANKYVLDIIFNSTDYKMIVLCNSLIGSGLDQDTHYSFISPDYLYYFVYNGKKWMEFSKESVGMSTLWNRYDNYKTIPGGGTSVDYKPYFNVMGVTGIYDSNRNISFVYPAKYSTYEPTAYEYSLTFGD